MVADTGSAGAARAARRLNAPRPALVESHADGTPRRVNRQGVAVLREEHLLVPRGETLFEVGDEVLALVTPDSEDEVRNLLTGG